MNNECKLFNVFIGNKQLITSHPNVKKNNPSYIRLKNIPRKIINFAQPLNVNVSLYENILLVANINCTSNSQGKKLIDIAELSNKLHILRFIGIVIHRMLAEHEKKLISQAKDRDE